MNAIGHGQEDEPSGVHQFSPLIGILHASSLSSAREVETCKEEVELATGLRGSVSTESCFREVYKEGDMAGRRIHGLQEEIRKYSEHWKRSNRSCMSVEGLLPQHIRTFISNGLDLFSLSRD